MNRRYSPEERGGEKKQINCQISNKYGGEGEVVNKNYQ